MMRLLVAGAAALMLSVSIAEAAGESSSSSDTSSSSTTTTTTSSPTTTTTAATPAAATDPLTARFGDLGPAYESARKLAEDGKYAEAIAALNALGKAEDPRVLNWLGYSTRKMGKAAEALVFYDKALSLAPDFVGAHEYRGEAYVMLGETDKAKAALAEIAKLCGNTTCPEHVALAKAIEGGAKSTSWWNWMFN